MVNLIQELYTRARKGDYTMTEAQKQAMEFLDEMRRNGMPDVIYESERRALLGDSADASPEAAPPVEPASAPPSQAANVSSALEWYVVTSNQQKAQVSRDRLAQMLTNEEITRKNLVWKKGWKTSWVPIETVEELQDILAELPPDIPVAPVAETVPSMPTTPVAETVPQASTVNSLEYIIDPIKCIACGVCAKKCPAECIRKEEADKYPDRKRPPYIIDQRYCTKCGECANRCMFTGAIIKRG